MKFRSFEVQSLEVQSFEVLNTKWVARYTSLPDPSQKAHNTQKPKQASHAASLSGKRNQPTSIAHNKTDLICSTHHRIFHQEPAKISDQNREEGNQTRKGEKTNNTTRKKKKSQSTYR
jgi:hypothetical protein